VPGSARCTVLLDLDGTLTDPGTGIFRCIAYALESLGVPVPPEHELRRWIGPPIQHSFARYLVGLDADADPAMAVERYRERFARQGMFENRVYPGVPQLLEHLASRNLRLLVATSKPEVFATRIVQHFGLDRWLGRVYGSELDGTRVDKVDLLQYLIECESLEPHHCIMVGDREHDMAAARYHGMAAVGVLWGYGSEPELLDAGADTLVCEPEQLRTTLLAWNPAG